MAEILLKIQVRERLEPRSLVPAPEDFANRVSWHPQNRIKKVKTSHLYIKRLNITSYYKAC